MDHLHTPSQLLSWRWLAAVSVALMGCGEASNSGGKPAVQATGGGSSVVTSGTGGAASNGMLGGTGGSVAMSAMGGSPNVGGFANTGGASSIGGFANTGGAMSAAGMGNAGAPNTYNPCPAVGSPCVIMPLGDSITEGVGAPVEEGGYRSYLFKLAHTAGKSITFVGTLQNGPAMINGVPFPQHHEGHGGFSTTEILPVAQNAIAGFNPNIVLLMIGTNDYLDQIPLTDTPANLGTLLDTIITVLPDALVVAAKIVPADDLARNANWIEPYNAQLQTLVEQRRAQGKHIVWVDMYSAFTANPDFINAYLGGVGVHPNAAGFSVMADTWYQSIGPLLR
ncbi:MAG: GDSL-type esterase/lipase family protein [Polyangiaceae bacterium]|nr:GDSL-type esterase/lipase family protein [Polyangiaceae bacterium]